MKENEDNYRTRQKFFKLIWHSLKKKKIQVIGGNRALNTTHLLKIKMKVKEKLLTSIKE